MAIDTAPKRLSIMDFGNEATMPGIPKPDGAFTNPDRQHLLWLYSGISAASGGGPAAASDFRRRMMTRRGR